jgi:hypothetical protein
MITNRSAWVIPVAGAARNGYRFYYRVETLKNMRWTK